MWRAALMLSLLGHVLLGLAFWLIADRIVSRTVVGPAPIDTRVREDEIHIMVSALSEARWKPDDAAMGREKVRDQEQNPGTPDPSTEKIGAPVVQATRPHLDQGASEPPAPRTFESHAAAPITTTFFRVATQARSVVYVIDCSGSMGTGGRLALARQEVLASLERLPPSARFQVIAYNLRVEPFRIDGQTDLVPANAANKETAARLLDVILPEGGTDHRPALQAALRLQPEAIYFLTDADDVPPDLVRALTQQNHGRTTIHAIELTAVHRDRPDMPLHVLARENRGSYQWVDVK